jgi:hypothetical protein
MRTPRLGLGLQSMQWPSDARRGFHTASLHCCRSIRRGEGQLRVETSRTPSAMRRRSSPSLAQRKTPKTLRSAAWWRPAYGSRLATEEAAVGESAAPSSKPLCCLHLAAAAAAKRTVSVAIRTKSRRPGCTARPSYAAPAVDEEPVTRAKVRYVRGLIVLLPR